MKKYALAALFLLVVIRISAIDAFSIDDFGAGVNCTGTEYDCGNTSDGIVSINGRMNVSIVEDDGLTTYFCATQIDNGNAITKTCIIRAGFNLTVCDPIINSVAPGLNKSYAYNCTSTNLSRCGWGAGAIPLFATPAPTTQWQINTAGINGTTIAFIRYICNDTPQSSLSGQNRQFIASTTKGAVCSGDNYRSTVYSNLGQSYLSGNQECATGYCSEDLEYNVSQMNETFNASICSGGCYNYVKDGLETEVDYGGKVCGNCTPDGKGSDGFYSLARSLQEDNTSSLIRPSSPFISGYCPVASDVGTAAYGSFLLLLIISAIVAFVLMLILIVILGLFGLILGRYIKKKQTKK